MLYRGAEKYRRLPNTPSYYLIIFYHDHMLCHWSVNEVTLKSPSRVTGPGFSWPLLTHVSVYNYCTCYSLYHPISFWHPGLMLIISVHANWDSLWIGILYDMHWNLVYEMQCNLVVVNNDDNMCIESCCDSYEPIILRLGESLWNLLIVLWKVLKLVNWLNQVKSHQQGEIVC